MTDIKIDYAAIANGLLACSDTFIRAEVEYPGSVHVIGDGDSVWIVGTANGVWGADFYLDATSVEDGEQPDRTVTTTLRPDADPADVVRELFAAMARD